MMMNKLAIIGIGLIGASLARALRRARAAAEIVGYSRTVGTMEQAVEQGIIDRAEVSLADCARDADMVLIAVPMGSIREILKRIAPVLESTAVVTDVGSVKGSVVVAARAVLGERFPAFVPGHPLAGLEKSGLDASSADLFQGRRIILTPEKDTNPSATARVRGMWQAVGADVVTMPAAEHDRLLAASSHLPHMLAYVLVDMLVRRDDHRAIFGCAAGGFRDVTRITASDPLMWRDIALANRDELLVVMREYRNDFEALMKMVQDDDASALLALFGRAKKARENLGSG